MDVVFTRVSETIKPKGKNKKVSVSPAVVELGKTIQDVQNRLKEGRKEVASSLDALDAADGRIDWDMKGIFSGDAEVSCRSPNSRSSAYMSEGTGRAREEGSDRI